MNTSCTLIGRVVIAAATVAVTGCTDGASGSLSGNAAGVTTIDVSLTRFATTSLAQGSSGGYSPAQIVVTVGTKIRFANVDSFAHTASFVGNAAMFPASSPLTAKALSPSPSGAALSTGGWSSGNLAAGASSPVFVADAPGTYLYGCFYHYGSPMRGAIVVR